MLCADMTASCFLWGASVIDIMWTVCGFRNAESFLEEVRSKKGLNPRYKGLVLGAIKSAQCRITHLKMSKKIKDLGPAADSKDSAFDMDGTVLTVAKYFEIMRKDPVKGKNYPALKHPYLPTINVGTKSRPILVPAELIIIRPGQSR
jgi:hypothetical protein